MQKTPVKQKEKAMSVSSVVSGPEHGSLPRSQLVLPILLGWAVLAAFFAFFDLDISIAVVDERSAWAGFLARFGQIPGLLLSVGCLVLLTARINPADAASRLLPYVGLTTLSSFAGMYALAVLYYGLTDSWGLFERSGTWIWMGIAALFVGVQELLRRGGSGWPERMLTFSKITVGLAVLNYLLCVQVLKGIWGRVRFRDLSPGYVDFTAWFLPQGATGHTSFPSGHSAAGWLLLPLLLLIPEHARRTRAFVFLLVVTWGVAVAASRVKIGAHYASDVLFSSCFGIVLFILLRDRFLREKD
jgi:membrane-associated phospholipid phosphatase